MAFKRLAILRRNGEVAAGSPDGCGVETWGKHGILNGLVFLHVSTSWVAVFKDLFEVD